MSAISVDVRGGVQLIRIDRPEMLNALDAASARAIGEAVRRADDAPDIHVSVLAGGDRAFCAGADLNGVLAGETAEVGDDGLCGIAYAPLGKPLIAAVEGWAVGAGMELLMLCDLIVASDTAKLALPEVKRGLVAAGAGALLLPRRVPLAIALELLLVGEPIDAARALAVGLVNRVVPAGEALSCALELGAQIAANAPLAVRATKAIATQSVGWGSNEMWLRQREIEAPVRTSLDAQEGPRAFLERRAPVWVGR